MVTTMAPAEIWKALTPSQRVTLLEETGAAAFRDLYRYGDAALERAGLKKRGHVTAAMSSGSARHALGRKELLDIGQTIPMPTSAAGFHTPRTVTPLGRAVAEHGLAILRGGSIVSSLKKTTKRAAQLDAEIAEALTRKSD